MSELSKTARASMKGSIGETKKDPFDTNEKKIRELRVQRENKLAVIRYDFIDALIEEYDKEKGAVAHLAQSSSSLLARAEAAEAQAKNDLRVATEISEARNDLAQQLESARIVNLALLNRQEQLENENRSLSQDLEKLRAFKTNVDEALNSGDGVYRP